MRVLVCGSRTVSGPAAREYVNSVLDLHHFDPVDTIIQGGAKGADSLAKAYAQANSITCREFIANWSEYGRSAGFKRNTQMLKEGKPDLVLAFVDKPLIDSVGTAMMVRLARAAGVPTHHFRTDLKEQKS